MKLLEVLLESYLPGSTTHVSKSFSYSLQLFSISFNFSVKVESFSLTTWSIRRITSQMSSSSRVALPQVLPMIRLAIISTVLSGHCDFSKAPDISLSIESFHDAWEFKRSEQRPSRTLPRKERLSLLTLIS